MYDQERMLEMARGQAVISGSAAVECLLDFSKGSMQMIATMRAPTYLVPKIADDEKYVKVEEGRWVFHSWIVDFERVVNCERSTI